MIKQNKFIQDIQKFNKKDKKNYEDKAFTKVIDNLFLKNLWGKEKAMGLDEYDSEKNSKLTLVPGHIYAFRYMAKTPVKYEFGEIKFEFSDTLPIVLCMKNNANTISGINLNLCNYDLRTLILNEVYNLDPEFFDRKASEQAHRDQLPLSKNISRFFMSESNQTAFLHMLVKKYHLQHYDLIYRTYSTKNIKTLRFIEPWQWQYIPFVKFKNAELKDNVLKLIWRITNIDKIKI